MGKLTIAVPEGSSISQEDIQKGLAMLAKAKDQKAKDKVKMQDPAYKAKMQKAGQKALAYQRLMIAKAKKAGITVTTEEIEADLAAKAAAKK